MSTATAKSVEDDLGHCEGHLCVPSCATVVDLGPWMSEATNGYVGRSVSPCILVASALRDVGQEPTEAWDTVPLWREGSQPQACCGVPVECSGIAVAHGVYEESPVGVGVQQVPMSVVRSCRAWVPKAHAETRGAWVDAGMMANLRTTGVPWQV